MPLKFDQPELLGKIPEGDNAIAHQALAHIAEADRMRESEKNKPKNVPTIKIDAEKAPFATDQALVSNHVGNAWQAAANGQNHTPHVLNAQYVSNTSQAQKGQLDELDKRINEKKAEMGAGFDSSNYDAMRQLAFHKDVNVHNRQQHLDQMAQILADPSLHYNYHKELGSVIGNAPIQAVNYSSTNEKGDRTGTTSVTKKAKFLVPDYNNPIKDDQGNPILDQNGNPQPKMTIPATEQEIEPEAQKLVDANPHKSLAVANIMRTDASYLNDKLKENAQARGIDLSDPANKTYIDNFLHGAGEELLVKHTAKQMFAANKGLIDATTSVQYDEPRKAAQLNEGDIRNYQPIQAQTNNKTNLTRVRVENGEPNAETHTYWQPANTVSLLNPKTNKPLNVSINNPVGTNETTGKSLVSSKTIPDANLTGINFSYGKTRKNANGQEELIDYQIKEDKSGSWLDGFKKDMTLQKVKDAMAKGEDIKIYPIAFASLPAKTKANTTQEMQDVSELVRLQKTTNRTKSENKRLGKLTSLYGDYIENNVSVNASTIPQIAKLAKERGMTVEQYTLANMQPHERQTIQEANDYLNGLKQEAKSGVSTVPYNVDGKIYNIPSNKVNDFLKDHPNAKKK